MSLTIRPLNSGYIPTKPLEYWYHFSCKKYVEKMGITNESDQLPDMMAVSSKYGNSTACSSSHCNSVYRTNHYIYV